MNTLLTLFVIQRILHKYTIWDTPIEIQIEFTPILMNGRRCNVQYGGIVPPSKWKSQSLIGKVIVSLQQVVRSSGSHTNLRLDQPMHIHSHSVMNIWNKSFNCEFCKQFLRFQDYPIHLDRTWFCWSCPEASNMATEWTDCPWKGLWYS